MDLTVAIKHILDGNGVIIMGAGASFGAKNAFGALPSGKDLATYLYEQCGITPDDPYDLQDASQCFEEQYSANALIQELRTQSTCVSFTRSHEVIYSLPWMRYYTTNYDDVALLAAKKNGKIINPVTITSDLRKNIDRENLCVHINGHIGNLNEHTLHHEFKLTADSYYSQTNILNSPWGDILVHDLEAAKCIVILGLSLKYDLDLSKIIFNEIFKEKTIMISSSTLSANAENRLGRFGVVYKIGVDGFADEICKTTKSYSPHAKSPTEKLYSAFIYEYKRRYALHPPAPDSVFRLFFNGQFDDSLFYNLTGHYQGIIYRKAFSEVKQAVLQNKKLIFVHADMGNGKTACINVLRYQLSRDDIHIFVLKNADSPKLNEEIDSIYALSKSEKVLVIIDDYPNYSEVLHKFSLLYDRQAQFVLTARSALNHAKMPSVLNDFIVTTGESSVINIDRLEKADLYNCIDLFDRYGLFGRRAKLNKREKFKYLSMYDGGASRFQSIMLEVLQSNVIKTKVVDLINKIKNESGQYHSTVLLILLVKVMNLRLSALDIERLSKVNITTDAMFTSNPAIRELVSFGTGEELNIKAPVTAKFILQQVAEPAEIIRALCSIAAFASQYSEIPKFSNILTSIISYSHINSFLRGFKNPEQVLNAYYDELSNSEYYRSNNFFWLQYAISCIETKRFDRAQQYLNTAYGLIPEGFVPFQINNQQARFYLERIICEQSPAPVDDFIAAHRLLMIPIASPKDDEYNVVKLFGYYSRKKIRAIMERDSNKSSFQVAAKEAYERTDNFLKRNPFFSDELKDMQFKLLEIAKVE